MQKIDLLVSISNVFKIKIIYVSISIIFYQKKSVLKKTYIKLSIKLLNTAQSP